MKTILIIVLIIIGIVFIGVIVILGFLYLLGAGFKNKFGDERPLLHIDKLKRFLGIDFYIDYTVIEYKERQPKSNEPRYVLISVSDESFKEIAAFMEKVKLAIDEKDVTMEYYNWYKAKDVNIFVKHIDISDDYLEVDCDNKTISFSSKHDF